MARLAILVSASLLSVPSLADESQQRELDSNRAKWNGLGIASYRYILWRTGAWGRSQAIGVTVRDGKMVSSRYLRFVSKPGETLSFDVTEMEPADEKSLDTVPELFELVAQSLGMPNVEVDVHYHPEYGFPTKIGRNQLWVAVSVSISDFEALQ